MIGQLPTDRPSSRIPALHASKTVKVNRNGIAWIKLNMLKHMVDLESMQVAKAANK